MKKLFLILFCVAFCSGCDLIPSERSGFCLTCHRTEGIYKNLDQNASYHRYYREKKETCIACHSDKSLSRFVNTKAHGAETFCVDFTKIQLNNAEVYDETDHDKICLSCHSDILEKKEVAVSELPSKLKKIGLTYDHSVHLAYKDFSPEEKMNLKKLQEKQEKVTLSDEEAKELELLTKIKKANCAECHNKTKVGERGEKYEDKNINYAARNPMLCTACHYDISLIEHPGKKKSQLPTEASCRRCHDGKLHGGNLRVFLADCEKGADKKECVKCHPNYSQKTP